jgi:hypothetical protein
MPLPHLSHWKILKIGSKCIKTASHPSSTAISITCTRLFRGKMHYSWFHGVEILKGRWQHREEMGYWYPSGLAKTICKWDINVPLVTKGLIIQYGCTGSPQFTMGFCSWRNCRKKKIHVKWTSLYNVSQCAVNELHSRHLSKWASII